MGLDARAMEDEMSTGYELRASGCGGDSLLGSLEFEIRGLIKLITTMVMKLISVAGTNEGIVISIASK